MFIVCKILLCTILCIEKLNGVVLIVYCFCLNMILCYIWCVKCLLVCFMNGVVVLMSDDVVLIN